MIGSLFTHQKLRHYFLFIYQNLGADFCDRRIFCLLNTLNTQPLQIVSIEFQLCAMKQIILKAEAR